jgi:hypothetical protein
MDGVARINNMKELDALIAKVLDASSLEELRI